MDAERQLADKTSGGYGQDNGKIMSPAALHGSEGDSYPFPLLVLSPLRRRRQVYCKTKNTALVFYIIIYTARTRAHTYCTRIMYSIYTRIMRSKNIIEQDIILYTSVRHRIWYSQVFRYIKIVHDRGSTQQD